MSYGKNTVVYNGGFDFQYVYACHIFFESVVHTENLRWLQLPSWWKQKKEKTDQVHEKSLSIKDGVDELEQGDGDYVTKAYVYEMMKMQESLFRNLFDSLLTNVNSRIDGVNKDLTELKSSLQFTQKDVEDLKPVTKQMTKIGKELNEV